MAPERVFEPAPLTVGVRPGLSFDAFYMANERRFLPALFGGVNGDPNLRARPERLASNAGDPPSED